MGLRDSKNGRWEIEREGYSSFEATVCLQLFKLFDCEFTERYKINLKRKIFSAGIKFTQPVSR